MARDLQHIAAMDYTPQYFEDLIVTIEVTNGIQTDKTTFPFTVVNYPVENYAPLPEFSDYAFSCYVGERFENVFNCIDPDCFIFSMSPAPATSHTPAILGSFRTDMDGLTWNGWPYDWWCWFEPWDCEETLSSGSGLFNLVPKWEWVYDEEITCTDARGGTALMTLKIIVMEKEERSNQSPVVMSRIAQPVTIKSGEEFVLHPPNFSVEDPDGDQVYASCNIGEIVRGPYGNFVWKFQNNFPGTYHVELIFYDMWGGSAPMELLVNVKPWWTY